MHVSVSVGTGTSNGSCIDDFTNWRMALLKGSSNGHSPKVDMII